MKALSTIKSHSPDGAVRVLVEEFGVRRILFSIARFSLRGIGPAASGPTVAQLSDWLRRDVGLPPKSEDPELLRRQAMLSGMRW